MIIYLVLALFSALLYAGVNVYDKYVVEKIAKHPLSYMVVEGICILLIAGIISIFLDWSSLTLTKIIFPLLVGLTYGLNIWWYYYLISKEDVSNVIGLIYLFPLVVALLSFIFIEERISFLSYIGMFLTIIGAVWLSSRIKKFKLKFVAGIAFLVVFAGFNEFIMKIVTTQVPPLNGWAISVISSTLVALVGIFFTSIRQNLKIDIIRFPVAFIGALITCLSVWALYYAMSGLPATIVSSLAATQPLFVVFIERIVDSRLSSISKERFLKHKLGAVALVVIGVVLIYVSELF